MKAIHKQERVTARISLMIQCAKAVDLPIIATTQYAKGLGGFVPDIRKLVNGIPVIDKTEFNAFANPGFMTALESLPASVDTLILTGVEAHICVHQTALGAMARGLRPWVVADAVSSREKKNARYALERFKSMGIATGPAEMAIYEITGMAGTPEFKKILPYIK